MSVELLVAQVVLAAVALVEAERDEGVTLTGGGSGDGVRGSAEGGDQGVSGRVGPARLTGMPGSRDGTRAGRAAVELRVSGASYQDVADVLALSSATEALALVERELAAHLTSESVEVQRAEASERLLTLLAGVMPKALDKADPEHLPATRIALALVDRHIRLHGLDRPTEVILHTPTAHELETWVANVVAHTLPDVEEADIIEPYALEAGDEPRPDDH